MDFNNLTNRLNNKKTLKITKQHFINEPILEFDNWHFFHSKSTIFFTIIHLRTMDYHYLLKREWKTYISGFEP